MKGQAHEKPFGPSPLETTLVAPSGVNEGVPIMRLVLILMQELRLATEAWR